MAPHFTRPKPGESHRPSDDIEHPPLAMTLLVLAAPMYLVALVLYTFVDTNLWLIFLWIAVLSTFFGAWLRCWNGT